MKFVSPVSGEVIEIQRGPKRRIDAIKIEADKQQTYAEHGAFDMSADSETLKAHLLASGCWPFIKQRPFDIIADPARIPKSIFISCFDSAPLSVDYSFILNDPQSSASNPRKLFPLPETILPGLFVVMPPATENLTVVLTGPEWVEAGRASQSRLFT